MKPWVREHFLLNYTVIRNCVFIPGLNIQFQGQTGRAHASCQIEREYTPKWKALFTRVQGSHQ